MSADAARDAVTAHYDERAASYDDNEMHRRLAHEVARFVGPVGGPVLDVGTGTGLALRALSADCARLIGVDRSARMLAVARAALPSAVWIRADAAALPLEDGSVDVLTCVTALHLLPDPAAATAEWARVLAPYGRIVTATFAASDTPAPPRDFPRRHDLYRTPDLVAGSFAAQGLRLARHAEWTDGRDRVVLCELVR